MGVVKNVLFTAIPKDSDIPVIGYHVKSKGLHYIIPSDFSDLSEREVEWIEVWPNSIDFLTCSLPENNNEK